MRDITWLESEHGVVRRFFEAMRYRYATLGYGLRKDWFERLLIQQLEVNHQST